MSRNVNSRKRRKKREGEIMGIITNIRIIYHQWRIRTLHATIQATDDTSETGEKLRLLWTGKKKAHEEKVRELVEKDKRTYPENPEDRYDN